MKGKPKGHVKLCPYCGEPEQNCPRFPRVDPIPLPPDCFAPHNLTFLPQELGALPQRPATPVLTQSSAGLLYER